LLEHGLTSPVHQHSIGYTGYGFYRSEDPTNSIKVLKEHTEYRINRKNTISTQYGTTMGMTPQRAELPGLNGGGAAAAVLPPMMRSTYDK